MSRSADELEHEVEASRERLDRTLGDLQSRLTGPGLARDFAGLRDPGRSLGEGFGQLAATIREHPLPALLIGAGLGLLAYDEARRAGRRRRVPVPPAARPAEGDLPENRGTRLDERLDAGVEETFPASDPVSVRITK
ncbi:DUF3618 domain-containing protein [Methylobacterium oxalidis]|uniref:DUF3618 domain-containing protein n=1 Tax=Methylobacterium oxalidis TaxID=944322 RepID=A0A512J986_9HYPH|nr:DUF3618 domain-containing protein [Methylobacterium oxalidis]GEP06527.1 hypothetical protein MOX02_45650 [Methylobacterium oxalidis]GJE30724.1 hypothetical protein LDDCCGHA_0893 [Methylobacterium oxalidis]GLS63895.1 hypothetical protein GCM10007888_22760 [Methylobacterium oxalidis]